MQHAVPVLTYLEKMTHPRWHTALNATGRLAGAVIVILSATMVMIPLPLSNVVPAMMIVIISLARLEEDGLLFTIAMLAGVVASAVALGAVWEVGIGVKWLSRVC